MFKSAVRFPALLLISLFFSGCGTQKNFSAPVVVTHTSGTIHGGQQPVSGATVQLYAVGNVSDGSASMPLLSNAAISGAGGGFSLAGAYTCPSASSLVYVVASGGNPGLAPGTNNAAITMMAALGPCGNLTASTFILIDELTTVAAVYSLAPYMSGAASVGAAPGEAAALASAFALSSELVNTTTGRAPGTNVPVGTTVPVEQINTIGNILASCINSVGGVSGDGSACGTLFSLTIPSGGSPATDTVTALLHLANNPTLNTAPLYNLASPVAPFQPSQAQVPPDLAVRLTVPSGFTVSPAAVNFASTRVGSTSAPQTITFTNNTNAPIGNNVALVRGQPNVIYSGPEQRLSGADPLDFPAYESVPNDVEETLFTCPTPVMPGGTCTLQFSFKPTAAGPRSAYLVVTNTSSNPVITVLLTGDGLPATAGPATLSGPQLNLNDFPPSLNLVAADTPSDVTLTNSGSMPLTIDGFSISNDPTSGQPAFTQTNTCGASLAPMAWCKISISAIATTQAYPTGVLTVMDDAAAGPQTLNLSYSNGFTGRLLIDFGSRSVGTQGSSAIPAPLGQSYSSYSLTGPNATDFSFLPHSSTQTTSCTQSNRDYCYLPIYFNPSALGRRIATVTVNGSPIGGVIGTGLDVGPHFSASSISFSLLVVVGSSTSSGQGVSLVNTGTVPLTLNAPVLSGANASDFSVVANCPTLAVNARCTVPVTAAPTQTGNRSATLTITDSTGTVQTVLLQVTGVNPPPDTSTSTLNFLPTLLGTVSAPMTFTITGHDHDPVSVALNDPNSPFVLSGVESCSRGTPCQVSVTFAPTQANAGGASNGYFSRAIEITDIFSPSESRVVVSGTIGPPPVTSVSVSPASLTFPLQAVGTTSAPQAVTLTNTGNQPFYQSVDLVGAVPQDYNFVDNCPYPLPVGATCVIPFMFSPTAAGTRSSTFRISSPPPLSGAQVTLTGTAQ